MENRKNQQTPQIYIRHNQPAKLEVSMADSEAYDWVFDYSLVFLESDKFDSAVMDFVDEVGICLCI